MKKLPWRCPKHPDAKILDSYDRTYYVFNGYPRGSGDDSNHKYECLDCGCELAPPRIK